MENKNLIIFITAILILICIVFAIIQKNKKDDFNRNNEENGFSVSYKEEIDEKTGEKYYQVYNDNNGEVIANVTEEWQTQIYIDNPGYVENQLSTEEYENTITGSTWIEETSE